LKSKLFILFFGIVILSGAGCKKEYPTVHDQYTPVEFYFNGTFGGDSINLQASVNNYYMFTSYLLDANGVYDYTGEFRDKNCSANCANSLKISFKDYEVYSAGPTTIGDLISLAYFSFASPAGTPTKYYMTFFDSLYNGTAQSNLWDFGDGNTSTQHNPVHIFYHPGIYNVSLNTQSAGACSSSLNNIIMVGQVGNAFSVPFRETSSSGNTVYFTGSLGGIPPATWIVDFGDGTSTTTTSFTHIYTAPGIYPVSFSVTDATGYTAVKRINAATQTATTCYNDFYPTDTIAANNPGNLSDVTIEWRDANGKLYTSYSNSQPLHSMFKVTLSEGHANNINGQPTQKVKAKISCTLFNGTDSKILSGDVTFAVAHLQ
jgi:PKD repeat protein